MTYSVRADSISLNIDNEVRTSILSFIKNYNFPYVTIVLNKPKVQSLFTDYFINRRSLTWLKHEIDSVSVQKKGVMTIAMTEANRLHTAGLGNLLLSKGITKCVTSHSYGRRPMSTECRRNLEGKILNIQEVIDNSFPISREHLNRKDIPMIPQHANCRHVMAPLDG